MLCATVIIWLRAMVARRCWRERQHAFSRLCAHARMNSALTAQLQPKASSASHRQLTHTFQRWVRTAACRSFQTWYRRAIARSFRRWLSSTLMKHVLARRSFQAWHQRAATRACRRWRSWILVREARASREEAADKIGAARRARRGLAALVKASVEELERTLLANHGQREHSANPSEI